MTYTYAKEQAPENAGVVTVKYQDTEGNPVATDELRNGVIGERYNVTPKYVPAYTVIDVQGNERGVLTEEDQEVVYTYARF